MQLQLMRFKILIPGCFEIRTVWTVIFLSGLGLSLMLSGGIWQIFNSSEIVMSIVTTNQPLSHFNFPAVTVCSHNRISKWKLDQLRSENSQLQALTEKELLLALKILIKPDSGYNRTDELEGIQETLEANGVTINHLINLTQQVAQLSPSSVVDFTPYF